MKPLSNVELKSLAPSIFATSPSFEVSEKYAFIPTIEVVEMFRNSSWYPVEAKESFVRLTPIKVIKNTSLDLDTLVIF